MSFDYAVVIAPDGRVLWINDGPEHPQSRTMGKRIWETVVPDQEQVVRSAFAECALTGRQTEVLAHCQNGPAFQMQFSRVNHAEMVLMLSRRTRLDVHLTAREIDVLRLICDDHTNDEIARRLRVKRTTVETHRSNIMAKLRCRTISGVVKTAVEYGLV